MHRKLIFSLIAVAIAVSGCGGGGGGGGTVTDPVVTPVIASYAGTWSIPTINLPSDRLLIGSSGEVFVNGETPLAQIASFSSVSYPTRIGTCDANGVIEFDGSWTNDGILYRISGSGAISLQTGEITVFITLTRSGTIILQNSSVEGTILSTTPPTVPTFPNDTSDDIDDPPMPPTY